jgi:predicted acyltransferase
MLRLRVREPLEDVRGHKRWTFPLVVVGLNSIAIYLMEELMKGWVWGNVRTHIGPAPFEGHFGYVLSKLSVLAVFWLICFWMYRRKIFLKI